jgi:glycosyltransferase involved in cell wall biosynthesis
VKIAMVTGSAGDTHCGVGDYAYELAQHLALDANVTLYHDSNHGPQRPPFDRLTSLRLMPVNGFSLLTIKWLAKTIGSQGYDIVHIQYPSKGYGTATGPGFLPQNLTGMNSRSRIVATLHEWTTSHLARRALMDQMLPSLDAVIVGNEQDLDALALKLAGRPVMMMPVGNVQTSQDELAEVWLRHEGKALPVPKEPSGPAGRIPNSIFHYGLPDTKGKGLELLLKALKLVRDAGVPAVLQLGGQYQPGAKSTEKLLASITELGLGDAVLRLGHIPRDFLVEKAENCQLAVFPFDEGFSMKRSSVASISHIDLPIVVGAGSRVEHPYYAPEQNSPASLSVLLLDLLTGRLSQEWQAQVTRQREFAANFSFSALARSHLELYNRLRKVDV